MSQTKAPVLGHCPCPTAGCTEKAEIRQTTRRGSHLYADCPACGLDQSTGQRKQEHYWFNTNWLTGHPPSMRPGNVGETPNYQAKKPEAIETAKPEEKPEVTAAPGDFDPGEAVADEPEKSTGKPATWKLVSAFVLAVGAGAIVAMVNANG